ncbi:MAG TPA: hypothetical protein VHE81_20495 [Lacipirellulaceae bacterium]|nr:hypothetical protein [Lacipirellulaceae bacterium]
MNRLESSVWPKSGVARTEVGTPTWGEKLKDWERSFEEALAEHSKIAIVAAVALGLAIGWVVKRK